MDSKGDFYAAEVSFCECGQHQDPHSREMVSLRKWRRRGSDDDGSSDSKIGPPTLKWRTPV